ncbi:enoyl-CoA hydratase/isomerase family protein [Novosphingobium sp. JCM 18896]|uniref:enoyl-CoA hydratase/isomerase family protein n=1 Tax=Novosphingobium sp. JCM 18896 TaxID=2989731 RepID=UPI0022231371|nr:enoyl-CoA hydratase/isomerase family protein [Novosphingobium sp. JCM 18896]MCW1432298.1 enoyl-CoA hydratase/isomerase family protein [Novosphingobium sp. JCM 18896]
MTEEPFSYANITVDHSDAVSWIVLSRPAAANALTAEMLDEFSDALGRLKTQGRPVIAIRGEGKGFCSGMDLGQYGGQLAADPVADAERLNANVQRWLAIWDHPKPVIAAVHGYCAGVAAQLCTFADITVVADDVRISEPGVPIGGGFIAPTWVAQVGAKRAKEFAFLPGNSIDGHTAVEWGWANHCVAASRLIDSVEAMAARIAMVPPDVLRVKKLSINRAAEAAGFRAALSGIAEMDSLLHLAPSVLAIRARMSADGLKPVLQDYRGPSSTALMNEFKE